MRGGIIMGNTGTLTSHKADNEPKGMTPLEIKSALILRGISLKNIADRAGVSAPAVTQAINQYPNSRYKGKRIRKYIAEALDKNVKDIWP